MGLFCQKNTKPYHFSTVNVTATFFNCSCNVLLGHRQRKDPRLSIEKLYTLISGSIDIIALSMALSSSLNLGEAISFEATARFSVQGTSYSQVDWPRVQFELYLSLDDVVDREDYRIVYPMTDCQKDVLSRPLVEGDNAITLKDDGEGQTYLRVTCHFDH